MEVCPCCGSRVAANAMTDDVMVAEVIDRVGLNRQTAIAFAILWRAHGRTLTRTTILDHFDQVIRGTELSERGLNKVISRLNLALTALGHPVYVRPIYGIGYRMEIERSGWDWHSLSVVIPPNR